MTVGVVITVYNLADFVAEAIDSVLKQSIKADRIIVVNDGSSDDSLAVIQRYSDNVTIIDNKTNMGVLPSVLLAIEQLDTDIIAMLDGDDRWGHDKIGQVKNVFQTTGDVMFCTHSYRRIDRSGKVIGGNDITLDNLSRIKESAKNDQNQMDILLKESILSYRGVWLGSALSFRRSCLHVEAFKKFSEAMWGHELSHQDQPIAAWMILQNPNLKIRYIDKVLFDYRIFGSNSSGSSASLTTALRTLSRSKATLMRTKEIVQLMPGRRYELRRQLYKLEEVSYLKRLYKKNYVGAIRMFVKLFFEFWTGRERVKEFVRLTGVMVLGPDRFLRNK
jgi:glycosyltransferase involved in cell wall biosynthesis